MHFDGTYLPQVVTLEPNAGAVIYLVSKAVKRAEANVFDMAAGTGYKEQNSNRAKAEMSKQASAARTATVRKTIQ